MEIKIQTPDGIYRTRCRYLVAADGAHSMVRKKLKAKDAESALFDTSWCIADVRMKTSEAAVRKAYLDNALNEGGAIWYHQMADGVWRTDWQISHYPDPEAEAAPARARRRLRKLLGPRVDFELVWVGPWRFRRRCLEKLRHGRVFFLGDAAAQHSPFGARGGNRAIQDANNLGWKLALVLAGGAHADLLGTYEDERLPAAREAVEVASRSAIFIGPETAGQRVFRDATLDLAQQHAWARELVNVGRLSVASSYLDSPLNLPDGSFNPEKAKPGTTAPDGPLGNGFLVDRLTGEFTTLFLGKKDKALRARYGVPPEGATYVFRPDGHILARCRGIDPDLAKKAIRSVLIYRKRKRGSEQHFPAANRDQIYDELSAYYDGLAVKHRERALARLAVAFASRLPPAEASETIRASRKKKGV